MTLVQNGIKATETVYMNLKSQLRRYLEKTDMTAAQLARASGVSKQVISTWLSGSSPRKVEQIKRVAEALNISVDHLCFGDGIADKEERVRDLNSIFGDEWVSGLFEVRLRRIKK